MNTETLNADNGTTDADVTSLLSAPADSAPSLIFRERAPRGLAKPHATRAMNSLILGHSVRIVGNTLDDAGFAAYCEQYDRDGDTTIVRADNVTAPQFRAALANVAKTHLCKVSFAADEQFIGGAWIAIGYRVTLVK